MELAKGLAHWEGIIEKNKKQGGMAAVGIGEALHHIKEDNLWQQTGVNSFDEYVEMAHGFRRSWASAIRRAWKTYDEILKANPELQCVSITRMIDMQPFVTDENAEDMLRMAATVPDVRGFEANLRNLKGKVAPDQCSHPQGYKPIPYGVCEVCGHKRRLDIPEEV